jgi:uncharacterized protein
LANRIFVEVERSELAPVPASEGRIMNSARTVVDECRELLRKHYGARLADVVLYGSVARGEDSEESDIDLLVLLQGDLDYFREIDSIIELLYPVQLRSTRQISAKPARRSDYENGTILLYRNAHSEGVVV